MMLFVYPASVEIFYRQYKTSLDQLVPPHITGIPQALLQAVECHCFEHLFVLPFDLVEVACPNSYQRGEWTIPNEILQILWQKFGEKFCKHVFGMSNPMSENVQ